MEPPPLATYLSEKSRKRVLEPDVIEIMPPIGRGSKSLAFKKKEVHHEIIDIDMIEDSEDVMVIDEKGCSFGKGKEVSTDFFSSPSTSRFGSSDEVQISKIISRGSQKIQKNMDDYTANASYDDNGCPDTFFDDLVYGDDYTSLQAHFDNVDIPPGVKAPFPWLQVPLQTGIMPDTVCSSPMLGSHRQTGALCFPPVNDISRLWLKPEPSPINRKAKNPASVSDPKFKKHIDALKQSHSMGPSWYCAEQAQGTEMLDNTSSSSHHFWRKQLNAAKFPSKPKPPVLGLTIPSSSKEQIDASSSRSTFNKQGVIMNLSPEGIPFTPLSDSSSLKKKKDILASSFSDPLVDIPSEEEAHMPWVKDMNKLQKKRVSEGSSTKLSELISNRGEDILKKYEGFKQFDMVQDHSDHHYTRNGSSLKQPSKTWAKKIQEEWRILEKDLSDAIYVRVYETRLDLLRAVIVGAEGTPYHDGIFLFDVYFPPRYPNVPPDVYYHSGGLRLNPNLYCNGKVCLSLLNTWSGGKNEKWIPGVSTMLQVLVSIQALILNAKPYFNEPGYASSSGSVNGEECSLQYNEKTFILSLKMMLYTMKKPPKHFEDLVVGHFCKHAHDILVACRAYMDGAQVGCLVRGGVQDVDEGDRSCSKNFRESLAAYVNLLVKAFKQIGAIDL